MIRGMPYAEGRVIHDADAHIMETAELLAESADAKVRRYLLEGEECFAPRQQEVERELARHADPDYRAKDAAEIMLRKNFEATGSLFQEDRPAALDHLGFSSQLVFNTYLNKHISYLEADSDDLDLIYGLAAAHNRAMWGFCEGDRRLLPTAYVPLADFGRTLAMAKECLETGFSALLVPSACPRTHSPSHVELFGLWSMAQDAGIPIVLHVGGGARLLDPNYFQNGLPIPPDFHGGAENFRSVDYMAIPVPPMQTLATLILDGILDQHPRMMIGVIEQGAGWIPSWMRYLDSAYDAFLRHEDRLKKLSMKPSEFVKRQIRATPYPTEDVGWIIRESAPEIALFSSDYPHVEGGRNPIKRFETTLGDASETIRSKFYRENFVGLMGRALSARGIEA